MDPLTTLGLVSNILQVISFGHEILSSATKIYASPSGVTDEVSRLKNLILHIQENTQDASREILSSQHAKSDPLAEIARSCEEIAERLLRQLGNFEVKRKGFGRAWDAVQNSIKFGRKRQEIYSLQATLLTLESKLESWWRQKKESHKFSSLETAIRDLTVSIEQIGSHSPQTELLSLLKEVNHGMSVMKTDAVRYGNLLSRASVIEDPSVIETVGQAHLRGLKQTAERLGYLNGRLKEVKHQNAIIRSLQFSSIRRRYGEIVSAYPGTNDWIFDKERETKFVTWLKSGRGIYWINGQAGSGKSTLMKFVSKHKKTREALNIWGEDQGVVLADHYFWHSGTSMQKSQQGLFQSLLYRILQSAPELVDVVCPGRQEVDAWDIHELKDAFRRLGKERKLGVKFCFFIDGLDEYGGPEEDIISAVQSLLTSENIKVCTSSRPWNAFHSEWASSASTLIVQDYTREDMMQYIHKTLMEDSKFKMLALEDGRCKNLSRIISERASGVWLWVYLATRDLLRDIRDNEQYEQLMARLNSYPRELKAYFENIMDRIDPIYQSESSQIFLVVSAAVRPLSILSLEALDVWKNPDLALNMEVGPASNSLLSESFQQWQPRLQNRCRDLLRITTDVAETTIFRYQIDFLHRTVRDFLRENHQDDLRRRVPKGFDATITLTSLNLVFLKRLEVTAFRRSLNPLFALVDELLLYAWSVEQDSPEQYVTAQQVDVLYELDRTMAVHATGEARHWTNARDPPNGDNQEPWCEGGQCTFLALAVQARLRLFVQQALAQASASASGHKKSGRPLLDYALRPKRVTPVVLPYNVRYDVPWIDVALLRTLLEDGAEPNKRIRMYDGEPTPWVLFLMSCRKNWEEWPLAIKESCYESVKLLLQFGADPDAAIPPAVVTSDPEVTMGQWNEPVQIVGADGGGDSGPARGPGDWDMAARLLEDLFSDTKRKTELRELTAKILVGRKPHRISKKFLAWLT